MQRAASPNCTHDMAGSRGQRLGRRASLVVMTDDKAVLEAQRSWAQAQGAVDDYMAEVFPPSSGPLVPGTPIPVHRMTNEQQARFEALYADLRIKWEIYKDLVEK